MLIKCMECELQVSDKAIACPHCGYPLKETAKPKQTRKSNKRRRLPNGFGQISEIKNRNLRKPFRAMVTVGKTQTGRPICKPLKPDSFFATYNEAYAALAEYNKNPYDLENSISVKELYDRWSEEYFKTLKSKGSCRTITSAWAYCSSVYRMKVTTLRARHIKGCIDEGTTIVNGEEHHPSAGVKSRIKSLFNLMLDYAVEYEIVDRNYARSFNLSDDIIKEKDKVQKKHIPMSDEEMEILWSHVDDTTYVDVILIQCYSGWRPQELGLIELANVDLHNWSFIGGMKSEAGTDRIVPIHSKIRQLVERKYQEAVDMDSKYLINCLEQSGRSGKLLTYEKYQKRFANIIAELNLNDQHRPHDPRKHFVTTAKKYQVDEYAIKYMIGHTIADITERVYTERDLEWLRNEMEKIR